MNDDLQGNQNSNSAQPESTPNQQPAGPQAPQQAASQVPPGAPPPGYYYPYPPQPPRRGFGWMIPVALGVGCLPWILIFVVFGLIFGAGSGTVRGKHVALIHIDGVITGGQSGGSLFAGQTIGSEDVVKQLDKIRRNDAVKAVVIRINSPGGSASGSEEVYNAIKRLRQSGKIVYASMGDVAASGGYYIASACDKIYANANTMTGSIGVIFSLADMSELYNKIGYKPEVVKAGLYKDIGSPNRPLTPEERTMLQTLVDQTYANFLQAVADGRHMDVATVRQLAEGRIYTGSQAQKAKLVDEIGGIQETVKAAALAGGITAENPKVVEYGERGMFGGFLSSGSESAANQFTDAMRKEFAKKLLEGDNTLGGLK